MKGTREPVVRRETGLTRRFSVVVAVLLSISAGNRLLLGQASKAGVSADTNRMSLYTRIGTLNVCIFRRAGVPFDKATEIAGETLAQIIRSVHGGRIAEIGGNALSLEEARRGAKNSVVMGSVEVCPDEVPLAIREKVKEVLAARSSFATGEETDRNVRQDDRLIRSDTKNQETAKQNESQDVHDKYLKQNSARYAASITVKLETSGPSGSGTLINKQGERYSVATACHVIAGSSEKEEIRIITSDNTNHIAIRSSAKRHRNSDFCTITFNSNKMYSIPEKGHKHLDIGDTVLVSGWSLPSKDIPSSLRVIQGVTTGSAQSTGPDGYGLIYTTTAPTLPGMSGGPIISDNKLVGIHGRAERAPEELTDGKILATSYSLGLGIELLEESGQNRH